MTRARLLPVCLLLCACTNEGEIAATRAEVIYGRDARREAFEATDTDTRAFTRDSLVAIILTSRLDTRDPKHTLIDAQSVGERSSSCADKRFATQPSAASCTGTLISEDLVLTAGHCFVDERDCGANSFVFNFAYAARDEIAEITRDDVHRCRGLIAHHRGQQFQDASDYAVVRLDRAVSRSRRAAAVTIDVTGSPRGRR